MKRTLFIIVCLLAAITTYSAENLSNSEVDARWRKTPIKVKNGGQAPNVVTLLRAFH